MRTVILAFFLLISGVCFGAVCDGTDICKQKAHNENTFSATLSITITSATTGCIHLLTAIDNGQTITSISGTSNVTWAAVQTTTGSFGSGTAQFKWWKGAITGATGTTVTINGSGVPFALQGTLAVFATTCTIDATTPVINTSTSTAPTNAAFTNTTAADLIFTGFIQNQASTNTSATPAGYTRLDDTGSGSAFGISAAYKQIAATGAQTATWTLTGSALWADLLGGDVITAGGASSNLPKGWVF